MLYLELTRAKLTPCLAPSSKTLPPLSQTDNATTVASLREQLEMKNHVIMELSMRVSELDLELQELKNTR
jgi:hypothetical protein